MAITQVEPNNNLDSNSPLLTKIKIEEGEYGEGVPEVSSSCHCLTHTHVAQVVEGEKGEQENRSPDEGAGAL